MSLAARRQDPAPPPEPAAAQLELRVVDDLPPGPDRDAQRALIAGAKYLASVIDRGAQELTDRHRIANRRRPWRTS